MYLFCLKRKYKPLCIAKYLIEECDLDLTYTDFEFTDCLGYAMRYYNYRHKSDFELVKYLIEKREMNINRVDDNDYTCLIHVCSNNMVDV